jgi:protein gp37
MGENSKIEWCHHTFNPWIGCTRVSPGCQHCYAESLAKRFNKAEWGPTAQRVRTSDDNWRKPFAWNRKASREGVRYRVFCASLADVFEANDQLVDWRLSLFGMIQETPNLDWLLLTKRPENVNDMVPAHWRNVNHWPANVWIGTSVENQEQADKRIPVLLDVPARVRFLSCEPLLGPVDLSGRTVDGVWIDPEYAALDYNLGDIVRDEGWPIHWVIVGGESGIGARPMNPTWVRSLRDQCVAAGVPFLFKQWGQYAPQPNSGEKVFFWTDKHAAGRELDGRTWDEYPAVETTVTA